MNSSRCRSRPAVTWSSRFSTRWVPWSATCASRSARTRSSSSWAGPPGGQTLLTRDYLWVGAGSERHLARLPASELLRLSRARQMDAVEDRTYDSGGGRSQKEA
jgi:hypothetical protein